MVGKVIKKECINAYIRNADVNVINKLPLSTFSKLQENIKEN